MRHPEQSIVTFTGRRFWPLEPEPQEVDILDIAHSLGNLCRYTGHTRKFYSVAQHSVIVSYVVPEEDALWGLLHDAGEAYLADIARPVKHQSKLAVYRDYERKLEEVIAQAFNLPWPMPSTVKPADMRVYMTERRDLMPPSTRDGWPEAEPLPDRIEPWPPEYAKWVFYQRYLDLAGANVFKRLAAAGLV